MDSQSVKNTDSAEQKGYDAGKKVSGIKRHIAVDTQGLPHAIHVTTANVTDRAGALAMFDQRRDGLSLVQNVLVDGGYTGDPFAAGVQSLLGASVEVVKRNEMHTFVVLPKRWVVERSFAWLEKCRRLWKNCERKLNTSLQMVVLAFAALILKRLQTGSKRAPPPDQGDVRAVVPSAGTRPVRLRRGPGGHRRYRAESPLLCPGPAPQRRLLREGLSCRDHRGIPGRARFAFAFLGGVPQSILYDNTKLAVARILGDGRRKRTRAFTELQSHYLFEDRFGLPGKGNDKGKVEGLVGYVRRNFLVPVPSFESFDALNAYLERRCLERMDAQLRGHTETIGERMERDLDARCRCRQ